MYKKWRSVMWYNKEYTYVNDDQKIEHVQFTYSGSLISSDRIYKKILKLIIQAKIVFKSKRTLLSYQTILVLIKRWIYWRHNIFGANVILKSIINTINKT